MPALENGRILPRGKRSREYGRRLHVYASRRENAMEIDRRNFIKGSLAVGSLAALGGLAGCSEPKKPEDKPEGG